MAIVNISEWARKAEMSLDEAVRGITIKLFSGVIMDTRVDTGRMRGNWQTSIGRPATQETSATDRSGGSTVNSMTSKVQSGSLNIMTNNVPYAPYWEQQDGMMAKNIARITRIIREEVKKVQ